jgi:rhodanese-related sulfurtransferase
VSDAAPIAEIHVNDLAPLLAQGVVLVDVRMPDEYAEAHVPGAQLIPLPELPERHQDIPAADVVYVVCRSGARSLRACEFLVANGRTAVNVAGGTLAWLEEGHDAVSGDQPG